jgi:hypothetical protein
MAARLSGPVTICDKTRSGLVELGAFISMDSVDDLIPSLID